MNPEHRGDAKDLAKRGFLDLVRRSGLAQALRIVPMFTGDFTKKDVHFYLSLLGFNREDLVCKGRFGGSKEDRLAYFKVANRKAHLASDIFLDPDRGLVRGSQRTILDVEVVTFIEVERLLPEGSQRVVLIYDESVSRSGRRQGMDEKLEQLAASAARLAAFAYFNPKPSHPNIVCVANQAGEERLVALRRRLEQEGIPPERLLPEAR